MKSLNANFPNLQNQFPPSVKKAPFSVAKLKVEAQRIHNQEKNSVSKEKSHKKDDHSL